MSPPEQENSGDTSQDRVSQIVVKNMGTVVFGDTLYSFTTEGGKLISVHRPRGDYQIDRFDVDANKRRHGIGKELLRASYEHAKKLGADVLTAAISSRPSLDAMSSVFGLENIKVRTIENYPDEGEIDEATDATRAYLILDLSPTEPDEGL